MMDKARYFAGEILERFMVRERNCISNKIRAKEREKARRAIED